MALKRSKQGKARRTGKRSSKEPQDGPFDPIGNMDSQMRASSQTGIDAGISIPSSLVPTVTLAVDANLSTPEVPSTKQDITVPVLLHAAIVFLSLVLWGIGVNRADATGLNDYGIVSVLPWQVFASLGLLCLGACVSVFVTRDQLGVQMLYLACLVLVLHATPGIVYGTLRYSWAWKHIGIVDFIQRHGTVDRFADKLSAYHNWPGLFMLTAWLGNAFGRTALQLANDVKFFPVYLTLCYLFALKSLLRCFTSNTRLIALALWIFVTGNWIGQDYFSPQGTTYLLYIIVLLLCLGVLPGQVGEHNWVARMGKLIVRNAHIPSHAATHKGGWTVGLWSMVTLVLTCIIVATHQLTPVALILSFLALVLVGRLRWEFLLFALVFEVFWLLFVASPFVQTHLLEELTNIGEGISAASGRLVDTAIVSPGRALGVIVGRVLTVSIAAAAFLGILRRLLSRRLDLAALALLAAPFPLLANAYGGEILFRVYLFALPMLAFFAAALVISEQPKSIPSRRALWKDAAAVAVSTPVAMLTVFGFLMANNGKDKEYAFTPDEVEAAHWIYSRAVPDTLLIEGSRNYPSQFLHYEDFTYVPLAEERRHERELIISDPVGTFARWLSDKRWNAGYVIITSTQKSYSDAEGVMPLGSVEDIEKKLLESSRFMLVKDTPNAKVFTLAPVTGRMGNWAEVRAGQEHE